MLSDFELVLDKYTQIRVPCKFATALVNLTNKMMWFNLCCGEDCMENFFEDLNEIEELVDSISIADMIIADKQQAEFW